MTSVAVVKLQLRKDTAANWLATTVKLSEGEPGFDTTNNILKIGPKGGALWKDINSLASSLPINQVPSDDVNKVAIGLDAGKTTQGISAVAIGSSAGTTNQDELSVAIGSESGNANQGAASVAIGYRAGKTTQSDTAVAIGSNSGKTTQGVAAISIGLSAGSENQQHSAVAIGGEAGFTNQGSSAIAIGRNAGLTNQGSNAIAIGLNAGVTNQAANSIILNATGQPLNYTGLPDPIDLPTVVIQPAFIVKPIRTVSSLPFGFSPLYWNAQTGEIIQVPLGQGPIEEVTEAQFGDFGVGDGTALPVFNFIKGFYADLLEIPSAAPFWDVYTTSDIGIMFENASNITPFSGKGDIPQLFEQKNHIVTVFMSMTTQQWGQFTVTERKAIYDITERAKASYTIPEDPEYNELQEYGAISNESWAASLLDDREFVYGNATRLKTDVNNSVNPGGNSQSSSDPLLFVKNVYMTALLREWIGRYSEGERAVISAATRRIRRFGIPSVDPPLDSSFNLVTTRYQYLSESVWTTDFTLDEGREFIYRMALTIGSDPGNTIDGSTNVSDSSNPRSFVQTTYSNMTRQQWALYDNNYKVLIYNLTKKIPLPSATEVFG